MIAAIWLCMWVCAIIIGVAMVFIKDGRSGLETTIMNSAMLIAVIFLPILTAVLIEHSSKENSLRTVVVRNVICDYGKGVCEVYTSDSIVTLVDPKRGERYVVGDTLYLSR